MILSSRSSLYSLLLLINFLAGLYAQITVVDDLGRTVTLHSQARRIISLAPSITETLYAIGAGSQIVGVTDYCNYPEEAKTRTHVGGIINPSIETIISLEPDLIIVSMEGNVREDFNRLTSFGIPVFVTNPRTLTGIYRSIEQLGILTGRNGEATRLLKAMAARVDSIPAKTAGKKMRTILFISLQPLIVVGKNTFLNELLQTAGAYNLAASGPATYPTYSREALAADDPEVIIVMSDLLADTSALLKLFPEWARLSAVRNHKIFRIDADIVSRPGPRAVDGLDSLFHILHTP